MIKLLLSMLLVNVPTARAGDGFPHSAEEPIESPVGPTEQEGAEPSDRSCDVDLGTWASHQSIPDPKPERAENWRFTAELFQGFSALIEERPGVIRGSCFGRSVQGRPLWALHILDPTAPAQYRILIFAQLHALEWIGAEAIAELAEELVAHPPRGVEVVLVPVVNRDGRTRVERDLIDGFMAYRRANANGVDLNRDWSLNRSSDALWQYLPFFKNYYYTTGEPLSQPETRYLDALAATGFDATVSLHAFGGYIYLPWAGTREIPPDFAEHHRLGRAMSAAQPGRGYRVVQLGRWASWFRGLGLEIDHMYGHHNSTTFLIELTRSGVVWTRPSTFRDYFRWYNPVDPSFHAESGVRALQTLIQDYAWRARVGAPQAPQVGQEVPSPPPESGP